MPTDHSCNKSHRSIPNVSLLILRDETHKIGSNHVVDRNENVCLEVTRENTLNSWQDPIVLVLLGTRLHTRYNMISRSIPNS